MKLNWIGWYDPYEGYGRFSSHMVRALQGMQIAVQHLMPGDTGRPQWMLKQMGVDWDALTISCLPPYELQPVPGRHWLYTMTEGSELPMGWADYIDECQVERLIVPCQANANTFRRGGVTVPIHVIHGGTDPNEFPLYTGVHFPNRPFTVLCLADRASRKGWMEVWRAFYAAFGPSTTGDKDVRLVVKCRPDGNDAITALMRANNRDPRIVFQEEDMPNPYDIYAQADVVALPSRFEGWGMPHREAAMMGVPVITQVYSGMDDGHTEKWSIALRHGRVERIPVEDNSFIGGEWMRADINELAGALRWCYENYDAAKRWHGDRAAAWLRNNQTWQHAANNLIALVE